MRTKPRTVHLAISCLHVGEANVRIEVWLYWPMMTYLMSSQVQSYFKTRLTQGHHTLLRLKLPDDFCPFCVPKLFYWVDAEVILDPEEGCVVDYSHIHELE